MTWNFRTENGELEMDYVFRKAEKADSKNKKIKKDRILENKSFLQNLIGEK